MTMTGGGASPDVCTRAPDTLATPLKITEKKLTGNDVMVEWCMTSLMCLTTDVIDDRAAVTS